MASCSGKHADHSHMGGQLQVCSIPNGNPIAVQCEHRYALQVTLQRSPRVCPHTACLVEGRQVGNGKAIGSRHNEGRCL